VEGVARLEEVGFIPDAITLYLENSLLQLNNLQYEEMSFFCKLSRFILNIINLAENELELILLEN